MASLKAGEDYRFGGFLFNPIDGNSYLAKMYLGWRGDWLFTLPYTSEPGKGAFLYIFYILLGHIARITGLSLVLTFHLARLSTTVILLLVLHRFFRFYLSNIHAARLAFLLASFGSGLGWLALPFGVFTADFWVAETFPFLSAFANPHFVLGLAFLLFLFFPITNTSESSLRKSSKSKQAALVVLASLLLALLSPFGIVIALVVWSGAVVWEVLQAYFQHTRAALQNIFPRMLWIAIGGLPIVLYQLLIISTDPLLSGWNSQNLTPTPPLWDTVVALSPLILLAPYAIRLAVTEGKDQRVIVVWLIAGLVLLYFPWGLQRRFMMGLYVPLSALAAMFLANTLANSQQFWFRGGVLFLLVLPTNLLILQAARYGIQTHDAKLYLMKDEVEALTWIEANTPPHALILAAPDTGLLIPAYTGRRVMYGHPFETVHANDQKTRVERFFQGGSLPNTSAFLGLIDYVFYGPRERQMGKNALLDGLRVVYQNPGVILYSTR